MKSWRIKLTIIVRAVKFGSTHLWLDQQGTHVCFSPEMSPHPQLDWCPIRNANGP